MSHLDKFHLKNSCQLKNACSHQLIPVEPDSDLRSEKQKSLWKEYICMLKTSYQIFNIDYSSFIPSNCVHPFVNWMTFWINLYYTTLKKFITILFIFYFFLIHLITWVLWYWSILLNWRWLKFLFSKMTYFAYFLLKWNMWLIIHQYLFSNI